MIDFASGFSVLESEFDKKHLRVKTNAKTIKSVTWLNNYLQNKLSIAQKVLFEQEEKGDIFITPLKEIKSIITRRIKGDTSELSIQMLIDEQIVRLNEQNRLGSARAYRDLKMMLAKYLGDKDIPVSLVGFKWLTELETKYVAQGHSVNGLAVYMRHLRSLINFNRKLGVLDKDFEPFSLYSIKTVKTRKRALSKEDFDKILNADVSTLTVPMVRARLIFLSSFYMLGISWVDLANLKVENIQDGKIYYRRAKTKRLYSVKITKPLREILDQFLEGKEKTDFIFPINKLGLTLHAERQRLINALARYNKCLNKLSKHLNIEGRMTSYVSRHSFATHARDVAKLDISVLSNLMGHNDTSTTAVYLASISDLTLDEAVTGMFEG
jgi:integrase